MAILEMNKTNPDPAPKPSQSQLQKVLTVPKVNSKIVEFQYAVRGAQAARAEVLKQELKQQNSLPFSQVINCNIGNPQQLGQKPITFYRQVAAMVEYPPLANVPNLLPADVVARGNELLKAMGGSVGAYSNSQGILLIRQRVAQFIEKRDGGIKADDNDIFLTAGARYSAILLI